MAKSKTMIFIKDRNEQFDKIETEKLIPIPYVDNNQELKYRGECGLSRSLDGVSALCLSELPKEEEKKAAARFVDGLKKLFSPVDNWTFAQQLRLSMENCVHCHTCDSACSVYLSSGKRDIYRPNFRLELLQKLKRMYVDDRQGLRKLFHFHRSLPPWRLIARLAELAYRCTLCRRCTKVCPMGVDNGLITRELRKLFSQELGIAPEGLHAGGTVRQLGPLDDDAPPMNTKKLEQKVLQITGKKINIPMDKTNADYVVMYTPFDNPFHLENAAAMAIIMDASGLNWTFSNLIDRQTNNYGIWYDDIQLARIAMRQAQIAKDLRAKSIMLGEGCAHAINASMVVSERLMPAKDNVLRETYLPVLEDLICNHKIKTESASLLFPVTFHDPCNLVRQMGIVDPQRNILKTICPQFREMEPHGVDNYCCGGGSGFGLIQTPDFMDWKTLVSGRMKIKQILEAFKDELNSPVGKYICTPCLSCRVQINALLDYYGLRQKYNIHCGGLLNLVLNAMADVKVPPPLFTVNYA